MKTPLPENFSSLGSPSLFLLLLIHSLLSYDCFPYFHGYFQERGKYYLVTELAKSGSLTTQLKTLTYELQFKYAIDILKGLKILHQHEIIHRDLKCDNCLIVTL